MPGRANEIAIGGLNDDIYAIGTNAVEGGYGIYSWNGDSWTRLAGGATKISVGSYNLDDQVITIPVIATEDCEFYFMWENEWINVPFPRPVSECDVAHGPEGSFYIIADNKIYKWNYETEEFVDMGG